MKLTKKDFFTIPNILSYFRILLIPFINWSYCAIENHILTIVLIFISALSDMCDGYIARRFNMISDFGKFIDPVADWLTQFSLVICVLFKYQIVWLILMLFVLRQILMFVMGLVVYKRIGKVNSSRWYGKANTVILHSTMAIMILFPTIHPFVVNGLVSISSIAIVSSLILYGIFYYKLVKGFNKKIETMIDIDK